MSEVVPNGLSFVNPSAIFDDMPSEDPWKTPSDVVGERVRQLRKMTGQSVGQLAADCAAFGAPELTADVIYLIENGRRKDGARTRKITVDELLILSYALGMCPMYVLLPKENDKYWLSSTVSTSALEVYLWLVGYRRLWFVGNEDLEEQPGVPPHRSYPESHQYIRELEEDVAYSGVETYSEVNNQLQLLQEVVAKLDKQAERLHGGELVRTIAAQVINALVDAGWQSPPPSIDSAAERQTDG
ncbi:MAG: hypothetical protein ACRDVE_02975 [Actinocrinis sp.]